MRRRRARRGSSQTENGSQVAYASGLSAALRGNENGTFEEKQHHQYYQTHQDDEEGLRIESDQDDWSYDSNEDLADYTNSDTDDSDIPFDVDAEDHLDNLRLLRTRQKDLRRSVQRLGRLQRATLKTMPNLEMARRRVLENQLGEDFRWLTFAWLGTGTGSILPRLLLLWMIGLPILLMRLALGLVLLYVTLGMPAMLTVSVTVGVTVPVQMYYREVLKWAMHDDTLQEIWDAVASALAIALALLVYTIRLFVEIHNGFCPFIALVAEVLYEVAIQLSVVWYAAPALQYMALWLLRLLVFLIEPMLDLLVTVFEAFMFLVVETVSAIADEASSDGTTDPDTVRAQAMGLTLEEYRAHCAEHPEDQRCWATDPSPGSRRLQSDAADTMEGLGKDAAGAMRSQGEMLLEVVAIVLTSLLRVMQALLIALAPMIYSFFRMVLPILLKLFPFVFELAASLAAIFVSDAFKRILDYLIQAIPIVVEFVGTLLCTVGIYLGSALCYIVYALAVTLSFFITYYVRPYFCGLGAFYGGCLESFVMSMLDGNSCYSCGKYNTACGCRASTFPVSGCGSACSDGTSTIPAPPPTASVGYTKPASKSSNYGAGPTNSMDLRNQDANVLNLQNTGFNSDPADTPSSVDSGFISVPDFKDAKDADASGDPSVGSNPASVRRRRSTPYTGTITEPDDVASTVSYGQTYQLDLDSANLASSEVHFSSSPLFYSELTVLEVDAGGGTTTLVPAIGSMPRYQPSIDATTCTGIINATCSATDVWQALSSAIRSGAQAVATDDALAWEPAMLASQLAGHLVSPPTSITAAHVNTAYDQSLDPWLRMGFDRGHHITQLRLFWQASDTSLQAPEQMSLRFYSASGARLVDLASTQSCFASSSSRTDTVDVSLPTDQLAYSVELHLHRPCAQLTGVLEFGPVYSLRHVVVFAQTSQAQSATAPDVPTAIPLSNPLLAHLKLNAMMWDACGQTTLDRLVDGLVGTYTTPLVVHESPYNTAQDGALLAASFELWPGRVAPASPTEMVVQNMTVQLRGPTCPPASALLLCKYDPANPLTTLPLTQAQHQHNACVYASPSQHMDTRDTRAELFKLTVQDAAGTLDPSTMTWMQSSHGFYQTKWTEWSPDTPLVRDCSYSFAPPTDTPMRAVMLWVLATALDNARPTDWATAQLELGLDPVYSTTAHWTQHVAANLKANAKQVQTTVALPQCPKVSTHQTPSATDLLDWSTYSNPFGSSGTQHRWLAIDEISARVMRPAVDGLPNSTWSQGLGTSVAGSSRRLLGQNQTMQATQTTQQLEQDRQDQMIRESLAQTKLSWEETPEEVAVAELLRVHGDRYTSSASEMGHNQPFYDDLTLMPDPDTEPRFGCTQYTLLEPQGNVTRVQCSVVGQALLPGPDRTEPGQESDYSAEHQFTDSTSAHSMAQFEHTSRELQAELRQHQHLAMQRSIVREYTLQFARVQVPVSKTTNKTVTPTDSSSNRRLLNVFKDAANAVADGFNSAGDSIKQWVKDFVNEALKGFEKLICLAMGCPLYCHSSDGCDDEKLGDCFEALGRFLLRPVTELLKALLRHILFLIDTITSGIARATGLGDMIKLIACMSCSITSVVSGVLEDFAADFPLSLCSSIVDKGGEQCDAWGLGGDDFGASVFGQVWPMIKLLFGLIQVLPAVVEVTIEVATVVFSGVVDVFPELLGDMFDVVMWFVTSSELIATVEILFEAFDPMLKESSASIDRNMKAAGTREPTGSTGGSNSATHQPVMSTCAQPGEFTGAQCGSSYQGNGTARNASRHTAGPITADSDLGFAMDGCGCQVQHAKCAQGSTDCPYTQSEYSKLMAKRANVYANIQAGQTGQSSGSDQNYTQSQCMAWPYCEGVTPRLIGKGPEAAESKEFNTTCVASKQCRMEFVGLEAFNFTKKTEQMFVGFSLNDIVTEDGEVESQFYRKTDRVKHGKGCYDDPDRNNYHQTFGIPDVSCQRHRRRATTSLSDTQRRMARRLMGVDHLFSDQEQHGQTDQSDKSNQHEQSGHREFKSIEEHQAAFVKAARGLNTMLKAGNKSYAWYQAQALRAEAWAMYHLGHDAYTNATERAQEPGFLKHVLETLDYTGNVVRHSRQLLFSTDGKAAQQIGCGWLDASDYAPNTYPCCKGLWCCVPPPFPDDFYVDKEWFTWKDNWQQDTLCPYLETYPEGWLFALRAICKLVRDAADGVIGVWPYNAMVDAVWGLAFEFPDDEWPESPKRMWTCVVLNIAVYVVLLLIIIAVPYGWPYLSNFYLAHFVILQPLSRQGHEIEVLLKRSYVPVGTAKSKRKEFNARLE